VFIGIMLFVIFVQIFMGLILRYTYFEWVHKKKVNELVKKYTRME
jgi:hypothetical protein